MRLPLVALALVPLASGCAAAVAAGVVGVGVVQYQRNELGEDFAAGLDDVHAAALEALARLELPAEEETLSPTEGNVTAGDLVLTVERLPEGLTRVRIRIGAFRTEDRVRRAELVLQEIGTVLDQRDELRAWSERMRAEPVSASEPES